VHLCNLYPSNEQATARQHQLSYIAIYHKTMAPTVETTQKRTEPMCSLDKPIKSCKKMQQERKHRVENAGIQTRQTKWWWKWTAAMRFYRHFLFTDLPPYCPYLFWPLNTGFSLPTMPMLTVYTAKSTWSRRKCIGLVLRSSSRTYTIMTDNIAYPPTSGSNHQKVSTNINFTLVLHWF